MKLKLLTLSLLCAGYLNAQNAYYDAIELSKLARKAPPTAPDLPKGIDRVYEILDHYLPPTATQRTRDQIALFYDAAVPGTPDPNPFIQISGVAHAAGPFASVAKEVIQKAGNMDVTDLADGFAKFIVKRTKSELSSAFFEKFRDQLNDPANADAKILFPQTFQTLSVIGDRVYQYEIYLNALREAFEKDLSSLPANLPKIINNPAYATYFGTGPLKASCLAALEVADGIAHKKHPGEIIASLDTINLQAFDAVNLNIKSSIKVLKIISASLKSRGETYWVSSDSLELMLRDPLQLQIYLGLIYQQGGNIRFNTGTTTPTFRDLLDALLSAGRSTNEIIPFIREFSMRAENIMESIRNTSKTERELSFQDYYGLFDSSIELFKCASRFKLLPGLNAVPGQPWLDDLITSVETGGSIAFDISRRNYSSAVINTYKFYIIIFPTPTDHSKTKQYVLKYGQFMAAIVQAENSDQISEAIESTVLPAGSSRIKRESAMNLSLNAYCGLFGGWEQISGIDVPFCPKKSRFVNSYGVTAPIGIALSGGLFHSSISLFASVIDIGAIAAFRFTNDTVAAIPNVSLQDIVSPGIFLSYGFPRSPLSINFGYQIGPILRKTEAEQNTYKNNYTRLSLSLVVDIPLFNFYTKGKTD